MALKSINSYLVHAGKHLDHQPEIKATPVDKEYLLFKKLEEVYYKSDLECRIEIGFTPDQAGGQANPCRGDLLNYIKRPHISVGNKLATRLQSVTTNKSGLGLLFLMSGTEETKRKLVVSRFPADQGILADDSGGTLSIEFIEKIFMKGTVGYKAVVYKGASLDSEFFTGYAVDKQINADDGTVSQYWIKEFLLSDLTSKSAAGSRRLATAVKAAILHVSDLETKDELISAVKLAKALNGKVGSAATFCGRFALSKEATEAIKTAMRNPRLFDEQFSFSSAEFSAVAAFRSVELNTGAILSASAEKFDEVFSRERIEDNSRTERFATVGEVVNQRIKKERS